MQVLHQDVSLLNSSCLTKRRMHSSCSHSCILASPWTKMTNGQKWRNFEMEKNWNQHPRFITEHPPRLQRQTTSRLNIFGGCCRITADLDRKNDSESKFRTYMTNVALNVSYYIAATRPVATRRTAVLRHGSPLLPSTVLLSTANTLQHYLRRAQRNHNGPRLGRNGTKKSGLLPRTRRLLSRCVPPTSRHASSSRRAAATALTSTAKSSVALLLKVTPSAATPSVKSVT